MVIRLFWEQKSVSSILTSRRRDIGSWWVDVPSGQRRLLGKQVEHYSSWVRIPLYPAYGISGFYSIWSFELRYLYNSTLYKIFWRIA